MAGAAGVGAISPVEAGLLMLTGVLFRVPAACPRAWPGVFANSFPRRKVGRDPMTSGRATMIFHYALLLSGKHTRAHAFGDPRFVSLLPLEREDEGGLGLGAERIERWPAVHTGEWWRSRVVRLQ